MVAAAQAQALLRLLAAAAAAAAAAASSALGGAAVSAWHPMEAPPASRRLMRIVPAAAFALNWEELKQALTPNTEPVDLEILVEDQVLRCALRAAYDVVPEALAAKVPDLRVVRGPCEPAAEALLIVDLNNSSSLSATVESEAWGTVYADFAGTAGVVSVYRAADARRRGDRRSDFGRAWTCHTTGPDAATLAKPAAAGQASQSRDDATGAVVTMFRMALTASGSYSRQVGGTLSGTLAAMATLLARVNGIYLRELGVFFSLLEDNDKLVCYVDSPNKECSRLEYEDVGTLLQASWPFLQGSGFSGDDFDIGHLVATNAGAVAYLEALCNSDPSYRARGLSAIEAEGIGTDAFFVDYVAHEIGHQFGARHTFRDCSPQPNTYDPAGAVEPGSGSTIMSYAGVCGAANLQENSDPYFNSMSLSVMRDLLESRVRSGCGTQVALGRPRPSVADFQECTVPAGNFVQLQGEVVNEAESEATYFAWDRVDLGGEEFQDRNNARFRPWMPSRSLVRYLPNMYYLAFRDEYAKQLNEIAPAAGAGKSMTFRFIARSRFSETESADIYNPSKAGSFGFRDLQLRYSDDLAPLTWAPSVTDIDRVWPGMRIDFAWSGGDPREPVFIQIAPVTVERVPVFRAEDHLGADPVWRLVSASKNNGSYAAVLPELDDIDPAGQQVYLMLESPGTDHCSYFDMHVATWQSSPTARPTRSPLASGTTRSPTSSAPTTASPSQAPTSSPTVREVPAGWDVAVCPKSSYNTRDGCDCGCGAWDPDCDVAGRQGLFCAGASRSRLFFTCNRETSQCERATTNQATSD